MVESDQLDLETNSSLPCEMRDVGVFMRVAVELLFVRGTRLQTWP